MGSCGCFLLQSLFGWFAATLVTRRPILAPKWVAQPALKTPTVIFFGSKIERLQPKRIHTLGNVPFRRNKQDCTKITLFSRETVESLKQLQQFSEN